MRRKWKRALSLLCTLAMIAGMLPVSSLAAAGQAQTVDGGINGYAAAMQADEVTNQQTVWQNAFYLNGDRSADLNGKIWTDKSVSIGDNNDFEVTFSALGQTFASSNTTQEQIAFDVVFIVDVSPSMAYGMSSSSDSYQDNASSTRMYAAAQALNSAVDVLMENENNRIGLVAFGGNSESVVPLSHYEKASGKDYFSYRNHEVTSAWGYSSVDGELAFTFSDEGRERTYSQEYISSTNPQSGILAANTMLQGASMPNDSLSRIPVIVLLTDGVPNESTSSYTGNEDSSRDAQRVTANDYYYTICSAAYVKDKVTEHYKSFVNNGSTTAKFYTIGLGLASGTNASIMLDPSTRDMDASNNGGSSWYWTLSGTINFNSASQMGFSDYNYADDSFVGEMTSEELETIFNDIVGSITSITGGASAGETVGGRDKITYFETLGEGVQFTG